ncbi:T9SS type A sorting domain-containing protein [Flavobacterium terrisoli]|uniref:T9SS type A sorting domain-containing protein n=1 Tax=Flavobacterium terrisoli TaxID=3242195 RepID=UPI0025433686|nr:T9SS type A sorting domain-containing protein [Flavobacterium buctense]
MKQLLLLTLLMISFSGNSQSVIQSINSGSIISNSSSVSIGEIVVVPQNQNQSSTGIIGLLAQTQQTLEVPQLELGGKITVFPNPTTATVYFKTETNLLNEKVSIYNLSGQLVSKKQITANNALDLSELQAGVYLIRFNNKKINSFKIIKR